MLKYRVLIQCFKAFIILLVTTTAVAQRLPNVQQSGQRAPVNAVIDGKIAEWGEFQSYNTATDLYYTMANDEKNLYLVIQSGDPKVITRLQARGVTLIIQKERKTTESNIVSVTYPISQNYTYFGLNRGSNNDISKREADSVMNQHNKMIDNNWKFIRVNGIPTVDTLISVYNNYGIHASGKFDNKKVLSCEFSFDLKYLERLNTSKYTYHIIVNGPKPWGDFPPGEGVKINGVIDVKATEAMLIEVNKMMAPTDFWGEYTLAK